MALILRNLYNTYCKIAIENKDPRIDHFFLMGSPLKVVGLTVLYLLFAKILGPKFMQKRKAFNLKYVLLVYNLLQILANLYIFSNITYFLWTHPVYADWDCMKVNRAKADHSVRLFYFYFLLKVVDYMDTIFMVLRKHNKQISYLHLYHHIIMTLSTYMAARFVGVGPFSILGYVNCLVHTIMYFYYFLVALRPDLKNAIWWKKYITQLQMMQFLTLMVFFARLSWRQDCGHSTILMVFCFLQNLYMFSLFADFYIKAYIKKT